MGFIVRDLGFRDLYNLENGLDKGAQANSKVHEQMENAVRIVEG